MDEQLHVLVYFSIILFACVFSSDLQEAKLILTDLPFPFEMSLLHAKERGFYVLTKQSRMQSSKMNFSLMGAPTALLKALKGQVVFLSLSYGDGSDYCARVE